MRDERLTEKSPPTSGDEVRQDRTALGGADRLAMELDVLRALCGSAGTSEQRQALRESLARYRFNEPEHQVMFESLCALSGRKEISATVIAVHLNNRGFPDLDLEKYFVAPSSSVAEVLARIDELRSAPDADEGIAQNRISRS
jgi:hypothetical protein